MNFKEILEKNNLVAIVGFAAIVIGGFLAVDDRYAHAGEVAELKKSHEAQVGEIRKDLAIQRIEVEASSLKIRKLYLEDKIFELEIKKNSNNITPVEKAQLDRFNRQMTDTVKDERKLKEKLQ